MKSQEHGVALIINNKKFKKHPTRNGTERDEINLIETFRFLGYRVEVRRGCTQNGIEEIFDSINTLIKQEDDSFICCILSHGADNVIYGADSEPVMLRKDHKYNCLEIKIINCQKLTGKPKLFFFIH